MIGARRDRPRSLRLAVQYADYWNTTEVRTAGDVALTREAVDAACARLGRDPKTLQRTAHLLVDLPGLEASHIPPWVRAYRAAHALTYNAAEELARNLGALAREGISHVQVWIEPNTIAGIDVFQPVLELVDRG